MSDYNEFTAQNVLLAFDFEGEQVVDREQARRLFRMAGQLFQLAWSVYLGRYVDEVVPEGLVYDPNSDELSVVFQGVGITLHSCGDECGCEFEGLTVAGRRVENTPGGYSFF